MDEAAVPPDRDGPSQERPPAEAGAPAAAIPVQRLAVPPSVGVISLADRAADAALVQSLALDDQDAAVAFVRRFQGPVFGLAVSITRDRGLAEDVSQEVFVRAWRAARNYDPRKASVLTWLLTITRNAAIDAIRMRRPTATGEQILDTLVMSCLDQDVESEALRHLEGDQARAQLRRLPAEQARAVVLAVIGGCTAVEVSERENIPLGTAKTRIRNGLQKLRRAWEEQPYE